MPLTYLDFDYSEDFDGTGTFDAMASVHAAQVPAVHAEIVRVLAWASARFPDTQGPLEDGGEWHYDLQAVQEIATPQALHFDPDTETIATTPGPPGMPRTTITLSISGCAGFCAALREAFALD